MTGTGVLLPTALILLMIAAAIGISQSKVVTPLSIARFTYRSVMFPFLLLHELSAVLVYRAHWLITGQEYHLTFDDLRKSRARKLSDLCSEEPKSTSSFSAYVLL